MKDLECRAILVEQTQNALRVLGPKGTLAWIPRSQITYCRRTKREDDRFDLVFTLPEWLIEKNNLWDLVP